RCRACRSWEQLDANSLLRPPLRGLRTLLGGGGFETTATRSLNHLGLAARSLNHLGRPARTLRQRVPWGEVGTQAVAATLAAVTRLLVATERARRVETVERVRPHDTRTQLVGDAENTAAFIAPNSRRKPVRGVV